SAVAWFDLVGKQGIQAAHVNHGDGGRELAVKDHVDAIGGGIATVGGVGYGDVAGVARAFAAIQHFDALHFFEVAFLDAVFNGFQVEHHGPVLRVGAHLAYIYSLFGVVSGGERVLALVVGVAIVQVAVHDHLAGDFHGVAINGGKHREIVFLGVAKDCAVIGQGDDVLAVAEHIAGAWVALRAQAVDTVGIGNLNDLVALHDIAAHASHAVIGLVVDVDEAPVIGPVGKGHMGVVSIAIGQNAAQGVCKRQGFRRQIGAHDLAAFVGNPPAGGTTNIEDRDAHQFAHGGQTHDADLAGLTTGIKGVVLVQLARLNMGALPVRRLFGIGQGIANVGGADHSSAG